MKIKFLRATEKSLTDKCLFLCFPCLPTVFFFFFFIELSTCRFPRRPSNLIKFDCYRSSLCEENILGWSAKFYAMKQNLIAIDDQQIEMSEAAYQLSIRFQRVWKWKRKLSASAYLFKYLSDLYPAKSSLTLEDRVSISSEVRRSEKSAFTCCLFRESLVPIIVCIFISKVLNIMYEENNVWKMYEIGEIDLCKDVCFFFFFSFRLYFYFASSLRKLCFREKHFFRDISVRVLRIV